MSHENLEIAREGVARFAARDLEALGELYEPDVVMVAPADWPQGGRYDGREAVLRQFGRVHERERATEGPVVMGLLWKVQGRASGVALEMRLVGAYQLRSGKIAEARFFWDFDEAIEAIERPEQDSNLRPAP